MNIAVIFAGGVGKRMHSTDKPKQFLEIYSKPIIIHTLEHFEQHPMIDFIVVVCKEEWIGYLNELLYKFRIYFKTMSMSFDYLALTVYLIRKGVLVVDSAGLGT